MTCKLKTNLLKIVCKRSELTRARFCGSSWTNKISETDKKSLFVNKTGEKFRSKVAKLSVGKTWSSIQEKYQTLIDENKIELSGAEKQCLAFARVILRKSSILV
ncbi:unnamed protein product [Rotaria sp. Silwood1]|nr:unnamed protein product [Rotaria sp. Silwood1]CAF4717491.1 unnamed protein product [Rotaria sp. Silwood1]